MNTNKLKNKIRVAVIAGSVMFGFVLLSSVNVQAQYQNNQQDRRDNRRDDRRDDRRNNDSYDNNGGAMYRMAVQRGYTDGLRKGADDARRRRNSNAEAIKEYRNASSGYNNRNGSKSSFQQAYREGFVRGYNEAYNQYNNRNDRNRNRRNGN